MNDVSFSLCDDKFFSMSILNYLDNNHLAINIVNFLLVGLKLLDGKS